MSRAAVTLIAAVAIAAAAAFVPAFPALTARSRDGSGNGDGQPYLVEPVPGSLPFILSYTHSVNRGRVSDYIESDRRGGLRIAKTRFESYGAGIPEPSEGGTFSEGSGWYEISYDDRKTDAIALAVGAVSDQALERGGTRHILTDYFDPMTGIVIDYERVSAFDLAVRKRLSTKE